MREIKGGSMRSVVLVVLSLALCAPAWAFGQERRQAPETEEQTGAEADPIELETTLVEVPVVVSEPGGRYVTDLKEPDFTISEDGRPQQVEFFASVDEPFNVALVVDTSGSTRDQ